MNLELMFKSVLNMSFTGSLVICFVLIARLLLWKAPKMFSYAMWAVVLFRLLCPVSFTSAFSLLSLTRVIVSEPEGIVTSVEYAPVVDIYQYKLDISETEQENPIQNYEQPEINLNQSIPENRTESTQTPDAVSQQAPAEPVRDPIYYAVIIWLVGMGVMLIYNIYSYRKLGKKIVGAVRLRNNIYLADHIPSPFVMGILRPKIYLPSALEPSERKYIIAHERYHIRRKDHIVKLLAYAALCVHWFNPLVWVAFAMSGKDMEMSCDEAVIRMYGLKIRADYSASLLRLATGHRIIAGTPLAFGEGDTKGRVLNMAKWKKPKFWVVICAAIVCIGVLVACAMNPAENNQQADNNETKSPSNETQGLLWITEMNPVEASQKAIDTLKNSASYYIHYEYSSDSMEDSGTMEYRRHGADLLIDSTDSRFFVGNIYFDGFYGMFYGDYWALEDEKSEYDPNEWLVRWAPEKKEISNAELVNGNTIVFDAVWPHQLHADMKYQGTFTYTFLQDGTLATVEREYVLMQNGEATSATVDKITIMDETPENTYAAIKLVADQCIRESELETYRSKQETIEQIPSNKTSYDQDFELGAGQMRWKFLNASWQFALGAENVSPTSVTLIHTESSDGHKSLVAEDSFWLEELVNGKWCYVDDTMTAVDSKEVSVTVSGSQTDHYQLDWSDSYGELKPGFYRVGRYYTVTLNSGETETNVCYAKFRIMDGNFEELLEKCKNAFDALLNGDSYHIYATDWMTQHDFTYYMTTEVWKNGEDYLSDTRYVNRSNPSTLEARRGAMVRDGSRYDLEWSQDDVTSAVSGWKTNTYLDETNFQLWSFALEWYDARVEDIVQNGNQISIIEKYDFNDLYENTEITLTFDDDGKLIAMTRAYLPTRNCAQKDKDIDVEVVVRNTSAADIAKTIDNQDLSKPMSFSYADDVAAYPDAQKSGFKNTSTQNITSIEDAIRIASAECTLKTHEPDGEAYNIVEVLYDSSAKIWKVIFMWSQNTDEPQYIYLNEQGITQMIVTK